MIFNWASEHFVWFQNEVNVINHAVLEAEHYILICVQMFSVCFMKSFITLKKKMSLVFIYCPLWLIWVSDLSEPNLEQEKWRTRVPLIIYTKEGAWKVLYSTHFPKSYQINKQQNFFCNSFLVKNLSALSCTVLQHFWGPCG